MTETAAAKPTTEVVESYFAMWNELDSERRRAAIDAAWASDGRYFDPMYSASGASGLEALAAGAHTKYPGHTFRLTSAVDTHHDVARWSWSFIGADGQTSVMDGVDFATLAADGRLQTVTGFFDPRS
jgi:hypothetical protein